MGLLGFYKLIKTKGGYNPKKEKLQSLKGKTVAIDGDMFIYKAMFLTSESNVDPVQISDCITKWLTILKNEGIDVIFVVTGGPPPVEKLQHCCKKRKRIHDKTNEEITRLTNNLNNPLVDIETQLSLSEKIGKMTKNNRKINKTVSIQIVTLLEQHGIVCKIGSSEADFLLVEMSRNDKCDYVISDDADILLAGAKRTIRNLIPVLSGSFDEIDVYERDVIMKSIRLDNEQFLQLGSLLSCDYQPPIKNLGPVTALKMIQKHTSIRNFLVSSDFKRENKKSRYSLPENVSTECYIKKCDRTVDIFKNGAN